MPRNQWQKTTPKSLAQLAYSPGQAQHATPMLHG